MSYQPYPTGGSQGGYPMAGRPPQPSAVRTAVWFMYGGAALSAISAVLVLAFSGRIKSTIHKALVTANRTAASQGKKTLTAAQIHTLETALISIFVIILVVSIALWLWMAWANGSGRAWARIMASVLFGLDTVYLLLSVSRAGTSVIFIGLEWLLGLGAIILLWRRESSAYFKPGTQ